VKLILPRHRDREAVLLLGVSAAPRHQRLRGQAVHRKEGSGSKRGQNKQKKDESKKNKYTRVYRVPMTCNLSLERKTFGPRREYHPKRMDRIERT
jgi:hypothetical protein